MKRIILFCLFLSACGNPAKPVNQTPPPAQTTTLNGSWNAKIKQSGSPDVNLTAVLPPGDCSIQVSGHGSYNVAGPSCVQANITTGVGGLTSTNSTLTPEGLLIGSLADPATNGSQFYFLYVATDVSSNVYVLFGTGTVSANQLSGNWTCYPNMTTCSGWSGEFTATR